MCLVGKKNERKKRESFSILMIREKKKDKYVC